MMPKGYSLGGNVPASKTTNGLAAHAEDFAADDTHKLLAIVEFEVNYSKKTPGSDDLEPVLQMGYIEPIVGEKELSIANELAAKLFTARTHEAVRPTGGKVPDPTLVPLDLPGSASPAPEGASVTDIASKK